MYVRLGEICDFQSGGTPSKNNQKFFGGDIPWITTVALNGSGIDGSDAVNWITEDAIKQSAAKIVPANSIMIGTRVGVGKVAINLVDMSTSQDVVSLIGIDGTRWCKEYLCKCLTGKSQYLNSQARGATIKGKFPSGLANLKIPEIPIEKQYEVSRIIDKTRIIIEQRKQELTNLDELMKARFVEMFGTPYRNEKGFPMMTVDDIVEFIGGAQPDKKYFEYEATEDNIRLIQIRDYKTDNYVTYIPKSMAKRFCDVDDIMIGRYGPPIFQILKGIKGSYNVALMKAIPKAGNKEFIRYFLKQDCLFQYLDGLSQRTAGQSGIEMSALKTYPFPYPPIELQEEFEKFAKQVDKSKVAVQKALDETQLLFDSLMQEYFG